MKTSNQLPHPQLSGNKTAIIKTMIYLVRHCDYSAPYQHQQMSRLHPALKGDRPLRPPVTRALTCVHTDRDDVWMQKSVFTV